MTIVLIVGKRELAAVLMTGLGLGFGQASLLSGQTIDTATIVSEAAPAVVEIRGTSRGQSVEAGTGFIVSADGKILTCLHVISHLDTGAIRLADGEIYDRFDVLAFDERRDLAIIKVPACGLPALALGDSDQARAGSPVVLIGNPYGLSGTVTTGVISGIRDSGQGFKVIQTDASANPGNSGGPLLDNLGKVIGVLDFKLTGTENLNFAIPINYGRGMLGDLSDEPMTLNELRTKLRGKTDVFASPSERSSLQLPIEIRIRHRHAWSGYKHAVLVLESEFIVFKEFNDNSHDFGVSPDHVMALQSSYSVSGATQNRPVRAT